VRLHQAAFKTGATPDQVMFHKPNLNRTIYIKELFLDEAPGDEGGRSIFSVTKPCAAPCISRPASPLLPRSPAIRCCCERSKDYARFLGHDAVSTDSVPKENREDLDGLVAVADSFFKQHWMKIEKILTYYNLAYNQLFKEQTSLGPFIQFQRASPNHFYNLGECISSIVHAIEVWNGLKKIRSCGRMKYERLHTLMGLTHRILE